jgi:small conductance mechanosensitive channel
MDPAQLTDTCGADPSWICETVLDASDGNEALARTLDFLLAKPLTILVVLAIAVIANRLLRRAIRKAVQRIATGTARSAARGQTIGQVLRSCASVVVLGIATLLVLGELGINLGPLLAGAGIAGVAIGFGAQSLVKDFLSGVFMLLEDQYGVGDVIDVGEASGQVEAVTLRSTRLRDAEGTVWHVPNGEIRRVGNKSQQWARAVVDVAVAYGTDVRAATDVIQRTAHQLRDDPDWGRLLQEDPQVLGVEALGPDGMSIRLSVQTEPGEQFAVMRELRLRLREALDEAGIELPYQRTRMVAENPPADVRDQGDESGVSHQS